MADRRRPGFDIGRADEFDGGSASAPATSAALGAADLGAAALGATALGATGTGGSVATELTFGLGTATRGRGLVRQSGDGANVGPIGVLRDRPPCSRAPSVRRILAPGVESSGRQRTHHLDRRLDVGARPGR
jgi:hypothetical protein